MKKHNKHHHTRISLSNIIKRLPLHHQLNTSQNALIDLTPIWQQWSETNLTPNLLSLINLNSFRDGVLVIACSNPTAASQVKHMQISLLTAFHAAGLRNVERIKVQIVHTQSTNGKPSSNPSSTNHVTNYQPLEEEALSNIKNCMTTIKNERLSSSLARLAETLAETHKLDKKEKELKE